MFIRGRADGSLVFQTWYADGGNGLGHRFHHALKKDIGFLMKLKDRFPDKGDGRNLPVHYLGLRLWGSRVI